MFNGDTFQLLRHRKNEFKRNTVNKSQENYLIEWKKCVKDLGVIMSVVFLSNNTVAWKMTLDNESLQTKGNSASGDTIEFLVIFSLKSIFSAGCPVQGKREIRVGADTQIIYGQHRANKVFKLQEYLSPKYVLAGAESERDRYMIICI